MKFSRTDVEFTSHGAALRGWLYRPESSSPRPGIVMAHGFTAVKEMFLDRYAEAFAAAGFTTLAYDHFGFGASDGEPRQSPLLSRQLQGYRDAIDWLGAQASVDADRLGIWGSSYSGGQVIMLATEELGFKCAVAQVPEIGPDRRELSAATVAAITTAIGAGRLSDIIPAVSATADGVGVMFEDDAYGWFTRVAAERAPSWRNEVQISGLIERMRPRDYLADVRVPLLLVMAPDDMLIPPGSGIETASAQPNVDVIEIPGGHFDAYEAGFEDSSGAAVEWFRRYLTINGVTA